VRLFRRRRPEPQIVEVFRYRDVPRRRGFLVIWGGTVAEAEAFRRRLRLPNGDVRCIGDTSVRSVEGMRIDTVLLVGTAETRALTSPVTMREVLDRSTRKMPDPVHWLDLRGMA